MAKTGATVAFAKATATVISTSWIFINSFSSTLSSREIYELHDSEVLYQSPVYFCDEHEGLTSLFIRTEIGNVPIIGFRLDEKVVNSSAYCLSVVKRLNNLMKTKGVRFLTWWDTPDGNYEVKISESEGYAIIHDKYYLFTLTAKNNPGQVIDSLRGIASTYGGEKIVVFE